MADIPDPSFELISNLDLSDVNEPCVVKAKENETSKFHEKTSPKKVAPKRTEENKDLSMAEFLILAVLCCVLLIVFANLDTTKLTSRVDKAIEMQINETLKRQKELFDSLTIEKMKQGLIEEAKQEKDFIDQAMKIVEANKIRSEMKYFIQFPENLMDKWIPDASKFKGVQEFLQELDTPVSEIEEQFYKSTPNIMFDGMWKLKWNMDMKPLKTLKLDDCNYYEGCHKTSMYIKEGDLYIHETVTLKQQKHEFTRVYYIPVHEFI